MARKLTAIGCVAVLLAASAATAQINQSGLTSAKSAVKVMKAKTTNRLKHQDQDPCSQDLNAGNVIIPEGARAPREVVVVIEGDVTNVGSSFGNARCRR